MSVYHFIKTYLCYLFYIQRKLITSDLLVLDIGGAYLLIETGGLANDSEKKISQNPTKLRFNVEDLSLALKQTQVYCPKAQIKDYYWGSTINVTDPDGNRVGIRDSVSTIS